MVTNPECWPRIAIILVAVLIYFTLITVYVTVSTTRHICRGLKRVWTTILSSRYIFKRISRRQRRHSVEYIPLVEVNSDRNKRWSTSTIIRLLAVVSLLQANVNECQQTILLPSTVLQCHSKGNMCNNHTSVIAKFNTMQSELCLQVKHKDLQLHLMKITIQELIFRYQKETLYYTQDTQTHVQYSKRCPHMGTCSGSKCAKISTDTLVEELDIANNFTGVTYCSESC